jgi:hypothetical protein
MGFMEQAAAKLARKFGTVSEGKHEGCQVVLGNDPSKKVEATYSFSQIIFLQGTEEKGRYNLIGDMKAIHIEGVEEFGLKLHLVFADGEESRFLLETTEKKEKEQKTFMTMLKTLLGQKKTNLTPEQKRMENVKNIKIFAQSTMELMDAGSLDVLEKYYKTNDVMEDLDKKLFEICRKKFNK